jgi:hypothetical protein
MSARAAAIKYKRSEAVGEVPEPKPHKIDLNDAAGVKHKLDSTAAEVGEVASAILIPGQGGAGAVAALVAGCGLLARATARALRRCSAPRSCCRPRGRRPMPMRQGPARLPGHS